MKITKILYLLIILNSYISILKHINNDYLHKLIKSNEKILIISKNTKKKHLPLKEENLYKKLKAILRVNTLKKENNQNLNKKNDLFKKITKIIKKEKENNVLNKIKNMIQKIPFKNTKSETKFFEQIKKIPITKKDFKISQKIIISDKTTKKLISEKILEIDYLFITNILTLIVDSLDFKLNLESLKNAIEQFEINLNYLLLQDLFKIKDSEEIKNLKESDFDININPAMHQKDISLLSGDCLTEENKNYNCLRIPFNLFINKNQGHSFNFFINLQFFFQDTINFSRVLVNEISMTTDEDYQNDQLLKINETLETFNDILFYNSGPLNVVLTGVFDQFFRYIRIFCDELRFKGQENGFVFKCYNEI